MRISDWSSDVCSSDLICKRAGIAVIYCAEQFENDGSPVSTIVKGVKRAMAGEYSRELSNKVFAGQCRLIERGHRDRKSTRLNSSNSCASRMPSSRLKKKSISYQNITCLSQLIFFFYLSSFFSFC